jgi:hypothetical protein
MKKNKTYAVLTAILIVGFGFFFTTRWWGDDDRPLQNTFFTRQAHNSQVMVRGERAYYIEPLHGLDLIFEQVFFNGTDSHFQWRVVVHDVNGKSYESEIIYLKMASNGNADRVLARVMLDTDFPAWDFVELIVIDSMTGDESSLSLDARGVTRVSDIPTIETYELDYENPLPSIWPSNHGQATESPTINPEGIRPAETFEGLEQRLNLKIEEFGRLREALEINPDSEHLQEMQDWYKSEMAKLENQMREMENEK